MEISYKFVTRSKEATRKAELLEISLFLMSDLANLNSPDLQVSLDASVESIRSSTWGWPTHTHTYIVKGHEKPVEMIKTYVDAYVSENLQRESVPFVPSKINDKKEKREIILKLLKNNNKTPFDDFSPELTEIANEMINDGTIYYENFSYHVK